ncbi:hypothetical protein B0H14DRAFT_2886996 [Mycena olivaceomarginata]|nr:hypothetical protein B0H14DRAFT_2886996 [Mycena olivaceomarginata]
MSISTRYSAPTRASLLACGTVVFGTRELRGQLEGYPMAKANAEEKCQSLERKANTHLGTRERRACVLQSYVEARCGAVGSSFLTAGTMLLTGCRKRFRLPLLAFVFGSLNLSSAAPHRSRPMCSSEVMDPNSLFSLAATVLELLENGRGRQS